MRVGHWEHGTKGPGAAPKLREGSGGLLSRRGEERNTGEHIHPAQNLSHPTSLSHREFAKKRKVRPGLKVWLSRAKCGILKDESSDPGLHSHPSHKPHLHLGQ